MKSIVLVGITIVNLALICYSIGIIKEQRIKVVTNAVILFVTLGVSFDIISTCCMIIGSTHTALSSHGLLGYSALILMLVDCILLWKHRIKSGNTIPVSKKLNLYSRFAYIWWVLAYITGAIIVAVRHS